MERDVQRRIEKIGGHLNEIANWVIRIIGIMIFAVLTYYSLRYTQYVLPTLEGWQEYVTNIQDSLFSNLFITGAAILLIYSMLSFEEHLSDKAKRLIVTIAPAAAMVWTGIAGFWWIQAADRQPVGDQAFIYGSASYFLEGDYGFLAPGGYCGQHPYQLGLIAVVELLFLVFGTYNYYALQVVCTCMTVLIVYFGFKITRGITEKVTPVVIYSVAMICCLPLVFYSGWVYGDIPGILFGLLLFYFLLRYEKTGRIKCLVGIVICSVISVLVRQNSMIMLVALCLVGGVSLVKKWDKKLFVTLLLSLILPSLVYQGIYKMYELRSGYPHSDGFPMVSYIAMGMQEENGKYGWYTTYVRDIYKEQQYNSALTTEVSKQDIRDRLQEFKEDPSYTWQFYREKVLSQWNAPLYESMFFSNQYLEGKAPPEDSFLARLNREYFPKILTFCDRLQFFIYFGMLLFCLFVMKKDNSILRQLLIVTIIGGFLFSILWEAKSRYILPYYIMMFPFSVTGYYEVIQKAAALIEKADKRH